MSKSWMVLVLVAVVALGLTGCASAEGRYSYPGSSSPDVSRLNPMIGIPHVQFFGFTWDGDNDSMVSVVVENDRPARGVTVSFTNGKQTTWNDVKATNVGGFVYVAEIPASLITQLGEDVLLFAHSNSPMSGYPGCSGLYYNRRLNKAMKMDSTTDLSPEYIEHLRQQLEEEPASDKDNG